MNGKQIKSIAAAIVCSGLVCVGGTVQAGSDPLRGKPFSDPAIITDMPADWVQKTIEYHHDAGQVHIAVDLNQQLYSLLLPLVQEFGKENGLKIAITKGTCGKSYGMMNRKEIDIGGTCCPPGDLDRLPGLRFHTLGIVPLTILVNPENPVDNISFLQARQIFQGTISNWSDVGGPDQPIQAIASFHCRLRPGHWRLLLDNEELFGPDILEVGEMSDTIYNVGALQWGIGYETMVTADTFKERGQVKPLNIDGHSPRNLAHLLSGDYPVYRTFEITTWEAEHLANPHAARLVKYLQEQVEQMPVEKYGLLTAGQLKKAGWKFAGDELVGELR